MKRTLLFLLLLTFVIFAAIGCQSQQQQQQQTQAKNSSAAKGGGAGASKTTVAEVVNSIKALEKQGREMEELRKTHDSGGAGECAVLMKKHGETVAALQKQIRTFSREHRNYLVTALTELEVCASCSTAAMGACDNVNNSIEEMQKNVESEPKQQQ